MKYYFHFNIALTFFFLPMGLFILYPQQGEAQEKVYPVESNEVGAKQFHGVKIENLGFAVNSEFAEYHPLISADESVMYFTSRRDNTTGGEKDPKYDIYYEDIYVSKKQNGKWTAAINMGKPLNTKRHDAALGLSPDGQRLFIYKKGDIYESKLDGEQWSEPVKLNKNINTKHKETSACFSFDGITMYFVSDRPGGIGENDIYMSRLTEKEEWGEAVNLGLQVNTIQNEDAVFMHSDGKTLYFSSRGHNSTGGYDIFKSVYDEKTNIWSVPENVGAPINTPGDDVFFVLAANGKHGYYSSIRDEGMGEKDIYIITFTEDKPTPKLTLIKGKITDKFGKPIEADIEVTDTKKNEIIVKTKSNRATGEYLFSLPSGKSYGITVTAEGYFFHSEHIDIPESAPYMEITKIIELEKLEVGKSMVLNYIFFDYDKATLKSTSIIELARAVRFMNENPMLMFEISGHTDNKGSWDYNMELSEYRAKTVVVYFFEHGINESRLVYSGYAFDKPVAANDTEAGRQKNRRVEMLIIQNTADKTGIPITFKVQILASETPVPFTSSRFNGLGDIQEYYHKGMYKYAVGKAPNLENAENLITEMKKKGFKEAFIVAFYKEQRIAMRTALKLLKQKS